MPPVHGHMTSTGKEQVDSKLLTVLNGGGSACPQQLWLFAGSQAAKVTCWPIKNGHEQCWQAL